MRQGNRWLIRKRDLQCNIKISVRLLVLLFLNQTDERWTVGVLATVVRKADEFLFLEGVFPVTFDNHNVDKYREEIMEWTSAEPPVKRAKPKGKGVAASGPTLLDSFVVKAAVETEDVIMNEDGTMYYDAADSSS